MEDTLTREAETRNTLPFIEKEAEMGFFANYFTQDESGKIMMQSGCQRISHCSCNCNDCSFMSG